MKKIYLNFFILFFIALIAGCASKPQDNTITTWHRVLKIDVDAPDDSQLIARGMNSGFLLITPHSTSVRGYHFYYDIYNETLSQVLPNSIPITYNEKVEYYLEFFQVKYRDRINKWLTRSEVYMPELKRLLAEQDMPTDLAYLPMIESGYNPNAVSPKYAVGLWQFISSTAKIYGLKIDLWLDQRKDMEKSTIAASNYLRDLYDEFGSWELALAGYNCGEIRIRHGVRKTDSNDYWVVSSTLPRETRNYVPKYIAAMIIAKNPEKYGFRSVDYENSEKIVKVKVPAEKSLNDIAKVVGYDPKELRAKNPSLVNGITPPGGYHIYIDPEFEDEFNSKSEQFASLKSVKPKRTSYITYRVRSGDNLWLIARRHGVSVNSIKRTNKLSSNIIRPGQKIRIKKTRRYLPSSDTYTVKSSSKTVKKSSSGNTYIVQRGDTIGEIAENHGVGTSALKRHNGLKSSRIKPGQVIKIPPGSKNSINYRIKQGDTLSEIADRYRVSVTDLKQWNNLKTSKLTAGEKLKIYR